MPTVVKDQTRSTIDNHDGGSSKRKRPILSSKSASLSGSQRFAAGGAPDALARIVASHLTKKWEQALLRYISLHRVDAAQLHRS